MAEPSLPTVLPLSFVLHLQFPPDRSYPNPNSPPIEIGIWISRPISLLCLLRCRLRHPLLSINGGDIGSGFNNSRRLLMGCINLLQRAYISKSLLPIICFRDGSPPLPDAPTNALKGLELGRIFNESFEGAQDVEIAQQCYPMQKNISLRLANEHISPGAWYAGLFNGIGVTRTQGKMIVRSSAFSFSANISVEGCKTATMWVLPY